MVIEQGGVSTLRLDIDRKAGDVNVLASFAGKAQSKLAATIAEWSNGKSVGASLVRGDAALSGSLNVALPESLRKLAEPVVDEIVKKMLADTTDANAKPFLEKLAKAIVPTLKSGNIDAGLSVNGPNADGKYTAVAGLKVKDGGAIEKTVKEILVQLPPDVGDKIKLDSAKAGSVNIHRVEEDKNADPEAKKVLGDLGFYVAIRSDALIAATGAGSLDAIKEGVASDPKPALLLQIDLAVARLAPLMARDNKAAPDVAKQVFDKTGTDKVSLTVAGGKALTVRINAKAQLLKFVVLLDQAKK